MKKSQITYKIMEIIYKSFKINIDDDQIGKFSTSNLRNFFCECAILYVICTDSPMLTTEKKYFFSNKAVLFILSNAKEKKFEMNAIF